MHFTSKPFQTLFATGALLLLSACGGEPSEADIKTAFEKQVSADAKAMEQIGGEQAASFVKGLMPEVKIIKKIGCKEDGENAYKCDVEMEVTQMGSTNKGVAPIRFVKGSDGWMATK